MFSFEDFHYLGHPQKITWGKIRWMGGWGIGVLPFVKNCWTLSTVWAGVLVYHPSWNGQTRCKSLPKNSLKPNTASHNNASWYIDTDGFLEHSPSRGSLYYKGPTLQKIIPVFWGGSPLVYSNTEHITNKVIITNSKWTFCLWCDPKGNCLKFLFKFRRRFDEFERKPSYHWLKSQTQALGLGLSLALVYYTLPLALSSSESRRACQSWLKGRKCSRPPKSSCGYWNGACKKQCPSRFCGVRAS